MMLRASLLIVVLGLLAACGKGPGGKLMVDTPVLPYEAPDVDEITGIDPEETEASEEDAGKGTPPAPAPAPAPKK